MTSMKFRRMLLLLLSLCLLTTYAQSQSYPITTLKGKDYYRYTVEKGIGLYRLSVKFNVSQEEILEANPQVRKKGLQYGTTILIPVFIAQEEVHEEMQDTVVTTLQDVVVVEAEAEEKSEGDEVMSDTVSTNVEDTTTLVSDSIELEVDTVVCEQLSKFNVVRRDTIRLAIMLPLQASATQRTPSMERFLDFYIGSILAIYEAQQSDSLYIDVQTYDVGKQTTMQSIVGSERWNGVDAIIGPAYRQQISQLLNFENIDDTWILIPFFSDFDDSSKHTKLLQFNPSSRTEAEVFAKYVANSKGGVNCVLVQSKDDEVVPKSVRHVHEALSQHNVATTKISVREILQDSLSKVLVDGVENVLIFNTEKYANLTPIMPYLQRAMHGHRITLYSRYSWQQEEIDIPQIYTSIFTENTMSPSLYKRLYKFYFESRTISQYPRYDLLGYDLTKQLIDILQSENTVNVESLWLGVQSNIKYTQSRIHSGYENQEVYVIRK